MVWVRMLFAGIVITLLSLAVILKNYEKETVRKLVLPGNPIRALYPMGLWIADRCRRRIGDKAEQNRAEALYIRDSPKERLRLRYAGRVLAVWFGMLLAALTGLILSFTYVGDGNSDVTALDRPSFGESETYPLWVEGLSENPVPVTVEVSGQEPQEDQLEKVFENALESAVLASLGKNLSTDEIKSDLEPVSVTDYGIRVQWSSSSPELISSRGTIVAKQIPETGVVVNMRAVLSYGSYERMYDVPMRLVSPDKDEGYYVQMLKDELKEREKEDREKGQLELPDEIEGMPVNYRVTEKQIPWGLTLLILTVGILLAAADHQNMKQEYEMRNQGLLKEYPTFLFKLNIMLSCGLTMRQAWNRMIEAYVKKKRETPGYYRHLYEEMITVQTQIQAGEGETAAYRAFGQRCGEACFQRLGNYLDQNVKQGVSGMNRILEEEMSQALDERRNRAVKLGEAMNTRLLLPMMGMLGVVLAILIAPAILAM